MKTPLYGPPERFYIAAAFGRGETELTAFDNALRKAGIADYNLLKVSSIIPPGARQVDRVDLPPGSLLPIAYGAVSSAEEGALISAAIAVGLPDLPEAVGVIMEFAGFVEEEAAREKVEQMAREALLNRGLEPARILVVSASAHVESPTCVFAGVALW